MALPPDVLERPLAEIIHRVAYGFLEEARAGCDRLDDPGDDKALHDFRVAVRRLRSTLGTWREALRGVVKKKHRRALRDVQRATGGGRDAEVALEWLATLEDELFPEVRAGFDWLCAALRAEYEAAMSSARSHVVEAFDAAEAMLLPRLEVATVQVDVRTNEAPLAGGILVAIMALKLSEELLEHLRAIHGPRAEDEAHEARICGKRLRYHVEPFRAQVGEARGVVRLCKELQDVLGDMNDARVLRAWIEEHRGAAPEGASDGIAWVLERIARRHAGLHAELELDWLADGGARLADAVAAFDHRMAVELAPAQEIERKYLLRGAPALPPDAQRVDIEQGYLPAEGFEDRLRRKATADGATYLRTLKVGAGLARFESEQEVDEATFEALWPLTEGRRVHKRRHTVQGGGHLWEIDEFLDRDLWLAEVELASTDEEAVMPAWLASAVARDVTDSGEFGNRGLAR